MKSKTFFYVIMTLCLLSHSCKENIKAKRNTNITKTEKENSNKEYKIPLDLRIEKKEEINSKDQPDNSTSIESEDLSLQINGANLIITKNGNEYMLQDVIVDAMSVSTSFHKINDQKFYLAYDSNASVVKSFEKYTFSYQQNQVRLQSKEIIKFGRDGICNKMFLFEDKLMDQSYNYDKLLDLGSNVEELYTMNPIIKTFYKDSKQIDEKVFTGISPEDYFIKNAK